MKIILESLILTMVLMMLANAFAGTTHKENYTCVNQKERIGLKEFIDILDNYDECFGEITIENKDEFMCVSRSIYHESRGESVEGQIMVANVIMNRVSHKEFPDTACKVVHQRNQFEWTKVVPRNKWRTNDLSDKIANIFLHYKEIDDNIMITDATFFSVGGFRNKRLQHLTNVGNHKFYRIKD